MLNKPLYLRLFPFFSLLIAVSFPVQIYFLYKIDISNIDKVFTMLTPLNLISMTVLTLSALLTFFMAKSIYKIVPILLALLFVNNAIVGLYGTDFSLIQVGLGFVLMAFSLKPFYSPQIRSVIMNPKLRWWETPKRFNVRKPLAIKVNDFEIFSQGKNFSKTGIFTQIEEDSTLELMNLNDVVDISIIGNSEVHVQAKIVRKTSSPGATPGLGLEIIKDQDHEEHYLPWLRQMVA
jgi:hypothetical protein